MTPSGIPDFNSFWPYYVREHQDSTCRKLHFVGTSLTFVFLALCIVFREPLWLIGMPLVGYSFAWVGHLKFEKNVPATFQYPLWSLAADYKMFFLTLTGRMNEEIKKSAIK